MHRMYVVMLISIFAISMAMAQNSKKLDTHQWKNRILLVVSERENSESAKKQLEEIHNNLEGIKDRKLVIYTILPEKYKVMDFDRAVKDEDWVMSTELFVDLGSEVDFRVILIGLDGTVKLNQSEIISMEKIFSLIDRMPMRRQELKNKQN